MGNGVDVFRKIVQARWKKLFEAVSENNKKTKQKNCYTHSMIHLAKRLSDFAELFL